jgi:hypothetical protein
MAELLSGVNHEIPKNRISDVRAARGECEHIDSYIQAVL